MEDKTGADKRNFQPKNGINGAIEITKSTVNHLIMINMSKEH